MTCNYLFKIVYFKALKMAYDLILVNERFISTMNEEHLGDKISIDFLCNYCFNQK